jgi:hypothetical protein
MAEIGRRAHSVPRLRRSCGCAAARALVARPRPIAGAFVRAKSADPRSLHLSSTAAAVVVRFFRSRCSGSVAGSLALGRAASPVLRCPRPATAGVLGPGAPSARPPATSRTLIVRDLRDNARRCGVGSTTK